MGVFNKKKIKKPVQKGVAKVPVVMQLEMLECGAACLTMILAYYDRWIPLEKVRCDCGVSRDGSNARNILKAARSYGFEAKGYRYEPEILKQEGKFPCIVHWEFDHFIVVDGFKNGKVYINDPARGCVTLTEKAFDEGFTGICLMMEPGEEFEPGGQKKSILGFVKKRLNGLGSSILFLGLSTIIASLFGIIKPGFSRVFIDRILEGKSPEWGGPFFVLLSIITLFQVIVAVVGNLSSMRISGKIATYGNASYMWKVLRMPMEFFSQRMAGDIQQRKETNASIAEVLVNTLAPLVINSLMMIFYLIVMIRYSIPLTIIGVLSIFVNYFIGQLVSRKRVNITRVMMRDEGKLYGTTVAGIEMIETIKSSGAENGFFEKWAGYQASVNSGRVKYTRLDSYLGTVPELVSSLTECIILIMGVYLVIRGSFTEGMLMAFQGFLLQFTSPATALITASQVISEMRTEMERIEDVMEYPVDVEDDVLDEEDEESVSYSKLAGNVELKNITFGYAPLGEPIIRDFSMKVEAGKKVAFVGPSGCGKSTLSKIISGLYEPWSGEVLFDGKPLKEIKREVLKGSLAVVDQDVILFEDSIADNIRMWDSSVENFEVILAARDADIHEDIMKRPGGYSYKIAEGGKDFSGGQRQRMEIARVLAEDPTVIIMDEATSALDARTEFEVVNSITERGITCIVVAHRLSTIRDCDEIIVLDKGVVVERGTHDELMKLDGYYTKLVTSD